jgi:hypothetical protein
MKVARGILILSFFISTVASATEYVKCDIGMTIMYHGKRNHLNLVDVRGVLINDDHDVWVVNFENSLPSEYTYLEGPELRINGNSCRYEKPPVTYDGK